MSGKGSEGWREGERERERMRERERDLHEDGVFVYNTCRLLERQAVGSVQKVLVQKTEVLILLCGGIEQRSAI